MREIKLRAWRKKHFIINQNRMFKVSSIDWYRGYIGEAVEDYERGGLTINSGHLDSCILMQFTGLKDKNGKEIYESDILEGWSKLDVVEVMWRGAGFWFVSKDRAIQADIEPSISSIMEHEYKIVRNIYENPELLKENNL